MTWTGKITPHQASRLWRYLRRLDHEHVNVPRCVKAECNIEED